MIEHYFIDTTAGKGGKRAGLQAVLMGNNEELYHRTATI